METKEKLLNFYGKLLRHFGPREWWPAKSPLEVIVGAVLTQAVAWRNVVKAIGNLEQNGILSQEALYRTEPEILEVHLKPTRYYRMKTRKLKAVIAFIMEKYQGDLDKMFRVDPDKLRRELMAVYGLGAETADSILLYAGNLPVFVVDGYTRRIFHRLGWTPEKATYRELQDFCTLNLPQDPGLYNDFHAQVVHLGNQYCHVKPACGACPVNDLCPKTGCGPTMEQPVFLDQKQPNPLKTSGDHIGRHPGEKRQNKKP